MSTVLDALAKADEKSGGPIGSIDPPAPPGPPRRPRLWTVLVVVLLLGGSFLFGLFSDPDPESVADPKVPEIPEARVANRDQVPRVAASPLRVATETANLGKATKAPQVPESGADAPVLVVPTENLNERDERQMARQGLRDQRLKARDAGRTSRKRAEAGDISREEYRAERRDQRALLKLERQGNQAARRASQLERRLELKAERQVAALAAVSDPAPEGTVPVVPKTPVEVAGEALASPTPREPRPADSIAMAPPEPPAGHSLEVRRWMPAGAPKVRIQILQWSTDDTRRFAFISVDGGRATRVTEGAVVGPLQVNTIYREMIEIEVAGKSVLLRAN
jgi:hypothetical protein